MEGKGKLIMAVVAVMMEGEGKLTPVLMEGKEKPTMDV